MAHTPSEADKAVEELRICRLELAQVRVAQEEAAEASLIEGRQLKRANKQLKLLAEAVDDHLNQHQENAGLASKVSRRLPGRKDPETSDVALLRASELFAGPWYLIQHPEVVASGQSAVLHYLRHGAAAGFDPSPRFNTKKYLREHPELAASGTNPLVHFLTEKHPQAGTSQ